MPASVSFRMPSWTLATPIMRKPAAELKSLQAVTGTRVMLCVWTLLTKPGVVLAGPSSTVESLEATSKRGGVFIWFTVRSASLEVTQAAPGLEMRARNLAPLSDRLGLTVKELPEERSNQPAPLLRCHWMNTGKPGEPPSFRLRLSISQFGTLPRVFVSAA